MKSLIPLLLLSQLLFAYNEGDTLHKDIVTHLDLQGDKTYVLDFFASWCGSCKKELPLISRAKQHVDKKKVEFIGIDVDKDIDKGISFQKALREDGNLNFRVVNDPQNLIISEFNPKGMPTLYFIKNSKVLKITTGAVDNIDEHILNYLKGIQQ